MWLYGEALSRMNVVEEAQSNRMCYSKSKMAVVEEAQSRMNVLQQHQDAWATEKGNEQ